MNSNVIYQKYFSWNFCRMAGFDLQLDNDGTYSMATIFLFLRSDRDWTCSIVPVYGDENLRYKENTIYTSGYWIIYNCEKIFRS